MKDNKVALVTGPDTFRLLVNYDLKVRELIRKGKYEWVHNKITSRNFPTKKTGKQVIKLKLFRFNDSITTYKVVRSGYEIVRESHEVIREMNKQRYRPAELHELLAFGAHFPEEQIKRPIIALGSVWRYTSSLPLVPCLGSGTDIGEELARELSLCEYGMGWSEVCRFLAVRKY